jgi:hypothetical protein
LIDEALDFRLGVSEEISFFIRVTVFPHDIGVYRVQDVELGFEYRGANFCHDFLLAG